MARKSNTCRRGISILTTGLALLILGGCMSNFYDTPKPFEGKHRNDPMLDSILRGASLEVRPVEGLSGAEAAALAQAISQTAHEHDIAAVTSEGADIADRLTGTAELAIRTGELTLPPHLFVIHRSNRRTPVAGAPSRPFSLDPVFQRDVRFSWTLTGADGKVKDTVDITEPLRGTVPEIDKRTRSRIAARTVAWLRTAFDREALSRAQAGTSRHKPLILVSPVEGASGDGRVSLTSALAELLTASGRCDVLRAGQQPRIPKGRTAYRVRGRVEITDGGPKTQTVAIAWTLTDLAGNEIGSVNQQNAVPRGSLDGAWGQTAYAAAEGAMEGLIALIDRAAALGPAD